MLDSDAMKPSTSEPEKGLTPEEQVALYSEQIAELETLHRQGLVLKHQLLEAVSNEKRAALLQSIKQSIPKKNN